MAQIIPFRGVRYNTKKVRELSSVVTPPYDCISSKMQDELYSRHINNFIRILLGKEYGTDSHQRNRYTRAARLFCAWLEQGILITDRRPSIYVYDQEFLHNGLVKHRLGFIALMRLEDKGSKGILLHENTSPQPKIDRLALLRAVKANLCPIFALFEDADETIRALKNGISRSRPFADLKVDSVRHRVWRISDPKLIVRLCNGFKGKRIFIADGHHRYEVALEYMALRRKEGGGRRIDAPYNYIMTYFSAMNDEALFILPIHRLVSGIQWEDLNSLNGDFVLERRSNLKETSDFIAKAQDSQKRFGLYFEGKGFFSLITKQRGLKAHLDVDVVDDYILGEHLGISKEQNRIAYCHDAESAVKLVDSGKYDAAIFLNPTKLNEVRAYAQAGKRMPQKSTFFYPKPLSGLVINRHFP